MAEPRRMPAPEAFALIAAAKGVTLKQARDLVMPGLREGRRVAGWRARPPAPPERLDASVWLVWTIALDGKVEVVDELPTGAWLDARDDLMRATAAGRESDRCVWLDREQVDEIISLEGPAVAPTATPLPAPASISEAAKDTRNRKPKFDRAVEVLKRLAANGTDLQMPRKRLLPKVEQAMGPVSMSTLEKALRQIREVADQDTHRSV